MKVNHHNIEPSLFRKGEFIGYDGRGNRWRVRKITSKQWRADPAVNHPGRLTVMPIVCPTLTKVAERLAAR